MSQPKTNLCKRCKTGVDPGGEDIFTCKDCSAYFHDSCLTVHNFTPNIDWRCDLCSNLNSRIPAVIVLNLQRLQEEIALERRILEQKYAILGNHLSALQNKTNGLVDSCRAGSTLDAVHTSYAELKDEFYSFLQDQKKSSSITAEDYLQQMFARQVIPSDLPNFNGRPEDWPVFYSSYNNSTRACKFSNVENLIRLQRCLQGPARDAVSSKLLLPECVPQIISTLKLLFGRPELLISSLLSKTRATKPPNSEDINALIHFGLAVQNFSDHITATGLTAHLNNPCLLQEMVQKLPAQLKLRWAFHKMQLREVNIATFSEFMFELVTAASQVTSLVTSEQFGNREVDICSEITGEDEREGVSSRPSRRERNNKCLICGELGHRSQACALFQTMTVESRWEHVNNSRLCPSCLNRHLPWPCRTAMQCGINGCCLKHHKLLHTVLDSPAATSGACLLATGAEETTSLKYIPVILHGKSKRVETFAFVDEGSCCTMIEDSLVDELQLEGTRETFSRQWVDGTVKEEPNSQRLELQISDFSQKRKHSLVDVRTVSKLNVPKQSLSIKKLGSKFDHLKGIHVRSYQHAKPRLIIGLTNAHLTAPIDARVGKLDEPIAFKCELGWCVYGGRGLVHDCKR
ncbi:uncharacterized protein LOC119769608 [Culex quinquefasciatus]|uniref:uncharacterized protein LOC119769608 n=1 Tax=Culex quinquefasciatus TaxID=7176 RepID=UPI0018E34028|nr:uncharacterized protein LOC119769608 [Culex quinquefasciatus]